ncbi:MAG: carbohydrate kinase [Acuticoccus sp.]
MIVACGEALVDLMPEGVDDAFVYRPVLGGSLYTVALGIARLGGASGYLWELSHDALGRRFAAALDAAGVDCSAVRHGERATPVAVVDRSGPEPRYNIADPDRVMHEMNLPPLPTGTRCLQIGSAVLAHEPVGSAIEVLARTAPLVSIDVNARPPAIRDRAAYRARIDRLAAIAGVIKASVADIALLGEDDAEGYMRGCVEAGAAMAVLTAAADGAMAFTRTAEVRVASPCTALVDPVGAGDSFMAAMLFRLQRDEALSRARLSRYDEAALADLLRYAQIASAYTCARQGAVMPTQAELAGDLACH